MKKTALYILIVVLVFVLGWQLGRMPAGEKQALPVGATEAAANDFDDEAETSAELEGMLLPSDSIELKDYSGNRVPLDSLIAAGGLIARYSANGCRPCINSLTEALKAYAAENPDSTVWLLIKDIMPRDLYVKSSEYNAQFRLLSCDYMPLDFNDAETPVMFRLDGQGRVRAHFTCRYGAPERNRQYLGLK